MAAKKKKAAAKKKAATKRRPCPSCGLPRRLRIAYGRRIVLRLVGHAGVRQRVCQACAALAVPVEQLMAELKDSHPGDLKATIEKATALLESMPDDELSDLASSGHSLAHRIYGERLMRRDRTPPYETSDYVATGIKCHLCDWSYRHGPYPSFEEKAKADRLADLHVAEAHPTIGEA